MKRGHSAAAELRQLRMAAASLLVDVRVGVATHLADTVAAEAQHGARALVHDVRGRGCEPQCRVMVNLAKMLAEKDPELKQIYGS
jgi:hypothetical protein